MTQEELKEYEGKKAVAVCPLSNFGGVEILDIVYGINDGVVYRYYDGPVEYAEIDYKFSYVDSEERAYFEVGAYTIYLDECMRV